MAETHTLQNSNGQQRRALSPMRSTNQTIKIVLKGTRSQKIDEKREAKNAELHHGNAHYHHQFRILLILLPTQLHALHTKTNAHHYNGNHT